LNNFSILNNYESVVDYTSLNMRSMSELNSKRQKLISSIVKENNLIELMCDYFGMDSYYYSAEQKIMYKVCNICDFTKNVNPNFEISHDRHIIELNKLPI
jgi:hypothetical protein